MKERILEFLRIENRSSAQFAEEIGVQPSSISHIISGRNNPSLDFVIKMLIKYPDISSDWLLFGKGQMYREPQLHDLFSSQIDDNAGGSKELSGNTQEDNFQNKKVPFYDGSDTFNLKTTRLKENKTKRIICFFDNDTFKEYLPGQE
jgi:transcriptional regulator with XRE-family HTH domain